jgi:Arc/MetJ-type ribon-helix-helix transcriptional regulator
VKKKSLKNAAWWCDSEVMTRLDVRLSEKMKRLAEALARDQGYHTASEYVRHLIRSDAKARGVELRETYPKKETS